MSSSLEKFNKHVLATSDVVSDYTAFISPSGDFQRVNGINAIINSWNTILVTPLRTYTFDPNFGSDLYKYVFEMMDDDTKSAIEDEIVNRILQYDDRAKLISINIEAIRGGKGFTVNNTLKNKITQFPKGVKPEI